MNADKTTDVWSITHKEDIGAGQSVGDVTFYAYLCRMADWRLDWEDTHASANVQLDTARDLPNEAVEMLYFQENEKNRSLIDLTEVYRTSGKLPMIAGRIPSLGASLTWANRAAGKSICFGDNV